MFLQEYGFYFIHGLLSDNGKQDYENLVVTIYMIMSQFKVPRKSDQERNWTVSVEQTVSQHQDWIILN